jgi:hypothetical protein
MIRQPPPHQTDPLPPLAARAQQPALPVIGLLGGFTVLEMQTSHLPYRMYYRGRLTH